MATNRAVRGVATAVLLAGALAACGQRGPLTLPSSAQPIERLEPPPADTTDDSDEERENER